MKQFIKDNLCLVVIMSILGLSALSLSIWGITKLVSSDDKKLDNTIENNQNNQNNTTKPPVGKYDSINDAKDLVDSNTIETLYNNVLAIGYNNETYTSEIYQDKIVTIDDLSNASILRAGITLSVLCGGEYENKNIPYNVIESKIKEIFNKSLTIDTNTYVSMNKTGGYNCNTNECIYAVEPSSDSSEKSYCTKLPLVGNHKLFSVAADFNNSDILYLYEENDTNMYRHIFKKENGKYYWYATEPLGK